MKTINLLIQKYGASPIVPIERVREDYFPHLTQDKLMQKIRKGDIAIPLTRLDRTSQKTAKGVGIRDLATFIDEQIRAAEKECNSLNGTNFGTNYKH